MTRPDDLQLMAYADGELPPEETATVEAWLARDPQARATVAAYRESATLVRAAFQSGSEAELPPALEAAVRRAGAADKVVPFRRPSPGRWLPSTRQLLPLAASLALIAAIGGLWLGREAPGDSLSVALATVPAGAEASIEDGTSLRLRATFQLADGRWCREFERIDAATEAEGVACRGSGSDWRIELLAPALAALPDGSYAPAGGDGPLEVWRDQAGAGEPVDATSEARLLAEWR